MRNYNLSVGLLAELAPNEYPGKLGFNGDAGRFIKLRLRTDLNDGFRSYRDIRLALCHELAHNKHGDHDKEVGLSLHRQPLANT